MEHSGKSRNHQQQSHKNKEVNSPRYRRGNFNKDKLDNRLCRKRIMVAGRSGFQSKFCYIRRGLSYIIPSIFGCQLILNSSVHGTKVKRHTDDALSSVLSSIGSDSIRTHSFLSSFMESNTLVNGTVFFPCIIIHLHSES